MPIVTSSTVRKVEIALSHRLIQAAEDILEVNLDASTIDLLSDEESKWLYWYLGVFCHNDTQLPVLKVLLHHGVKLRLTDCSDGSLFKRLNLEGRESVVDELTEAGVSRKMLPYPSRAMLNALSYEPMDSMSSANISFSSSIA